MFTYEELIILLREDILFLRNSCLSFDNGFHSEAKRLAVTTRVLLHHTSNSNSLFDQLGINIIPFYTTAYSWNSKNLLPHHGLIQVGFEKGNPTYRAPLDNRPPHLLRYIQFEEWWTELVFDDRHGNTLTRKDIVLSLSNKEGGAHVDPNLTESYEAITRNSAFWFLSTPEGNKPLSGKMELYAMRQIAHEMLRTLEQAGYTN